MLFRRLHLPRSKRARVIEVWNEFFVDSQQLAYFAENIQSRNDLARKKALEKFSPIVKILGEKDAEYFISRYHYVRAMVNGKMYTHLDSILGKGWHYPRES